MNVFLTNVFCGVEYPLLKQYSLDGLDEAPNSPATQTLTAEMLCINIHYWHLASPRDTPLKLREKREKKKGRQAAKPAEKVEEKEMAAAKSATTISTMNIFLTNIFCGVELPLFQQYNVDGLDDGNWGTPPAQVSAPFFLTWHDFPRSNAGTGRKSLKRCLDSFYTSSRFSKRELRKTMDKCPR
ncbi:uncharacterized protein K452DRAFT_301140 [Aplosporella prunicola CBS 121167]|uniref:Uncharacterized protein n=1 Tax=Aplosporella prunicola CBS 121167 TaxID=1176127 RepID=A0A6A6B351_9PEZI|nr:uncharacterized protein K452DRAFT_301140 [Aplosporella prunicola CBS 121167]KAF2138619.1 hypothetical protein K452DRAFT_301140 [Aplosporella prunicola CBS 121167]